MKKLLKSAIWLLATIIMFLLTLYSVYMAYAQDIRYIGICIIALYGALLSLGIFLSRNNPVDSAFPVVMRFN